MNKFKLTVCQEKAVKDFVEFMTNPTQNMFILSGPGGSGKSSVIPYLINELEKIHKLNTLFNPNIMEIENISYCASTNKSAAVLTNFVNKPVYTIHSLFNLARKIDKDTGKISFYNNKNKPSKLTENTLLIIEEVSQISPDLFNTIKEGLPNNTKVVLCGDSMQLPPVKHLESPVFNLGFNQTNLETMVRFDNKDLVDLNLELRLAVKELRLPKLTTNNSIKVLNKIDFEKLMIEYSVLNLDCKVIAWSNRKVNYYAELIHKKLFGKVKYNIGQKLLTKSYIKFKGAVINTQTELVILDTPKLINVDIEDTVLEFYMLSTDSGFIHVPINKAKAIKAIKHLKDNKQWSKWYGYKDSFADVISPYAITAHMSQASTYDIVFVDLVDIMRNKNFNEMLRLIYVAASRARKEVIFYGG